MTNSLWPKARLAVLALWEELRLSEDILEAMADSHPTVEHKGHTWEVLASMEAMRRLLAANLTLDHPTASTPGL